MFDAIKAVMAKRQGRIGRVVGVVRFPAMAADIVQGLCVPRAKQRLDHFGFHDVDDLGAVLGNSTFHHLVVRLIRLLKQGN